MYFVHRETLTSIQDRLKAIKTNEPLNYHYKVYYTYTITPYNNNEESAIRNTNKPDAAIKRFTKSLSLLLRTRLCVFDFNRRISFGRPDTITSLTIYSGA